MKMFYSSIISYAQDGASTTDATIKTFLKRRINNRYETATSKLNTWTQSLTRTAATVADRQYYYNPPNLREIESIVVTIGSFDYPLVPVYSQEEWDILNAQVVTSTFPERYFRRTNDWGMWPPDSAADDTISITYTQRAVPLYFENYTTGTVTVTENDQTVTVATGNFTTGAVKPGLWFVLTDSTGEPRGSYYKILSVTDANNLELETYFEETGEAGATYIIGQCPEIPEEGHELLGIGALADFYALKTKDLETSTRFNNMFWTGSPNVTPLQARGRKDLGGLLGLVETYKDRDNSVVVERNPVYRDVLEFRVPRTITV